MIEFNPTHKGLMFGIVPVYIDMHDDECPSIIGRNWFCEYVLLTPVEVLFNVLCMMMTFFNPEYEPTFPITITKEL